MRAAAVFLLLSACSVSYMPNCMQACNATDGVELREGVQ